MHKSRILIVSLLALTACGCEPSGDVVTVGEQSLTQDRLLDYLALTGETRAGTYAAADALAQGWLDLTLVAEAAGNGLTAADTALQREVLAPWVRVETLRRLQNALARERGLLREEEIDRTFRGDSLRLFQRVLVRVPDWRDDLLVSMRRARADSIRAAAQAGFPFDQLAIELSEDPNAPYGGYLGVLTRNAIQAPFRDSLWALEPGGVSPVLPIEEGFQILRRPPFAEARDHLAAHLLRVSGARADSLLTDSLSAAHGLSSLPATAERLRAELTNPDSLAPDSAFIVRFDDGGLTPEQAWPWLASLPDATRFSLVRGSDVGLEEAARAVARNELLYRLARERGINVDADDLAGLREEFVTAADSLFSTFAGAEASARAQLVDSIVGSLLAGQPTRLLPAGLAPALRRRLPHAFDRDALAAVARRASFEIRADSVPGRG